MNRRNFLSLGCAGTAFVLSGCILRDDRQVRVAINERVEQESTYTIEVEASDEIEFQIQTDDGDWTTVQVIDLDNRSVVLEFAGSNRASVTLTAETSSRYRMRVIPEEATVLTVRIN